MAKLYGQYKVKRQAHQAIKKMALKSFTVSEIELYILEEFALSRTFVLNYLEILETHGFITVKGEDIKPREIYDEGEKEADEILGKLTDKDKPRSKKES